MYYKALADVLPEPENLPTSPLIEFIRLGLKHQAIPLTSGQPHPEVFPLDELATSAAEALRTNGSRFLSYGSPRGLGLLRRQLLQWQKDNLILPPSVAEDHILLTIGAQGAFDLLCQAFLRPGDLVACDAPCYPDTWVTVLRRGGSLVPIPVEAEGLDTMALEEALERGARPRLLYTIPTYQNPTGASLSPSRSQHLAHLARRFGFLVVLDDPYRFLHLDEPMRQGESYLPWLGWEEGLTVLLGSLSKIIAPGLRAGWLCAHPSIVERLGALQEMACISLPAIDALTISHFIAAYGLEKQTEKMRRFLGSRKAALIQALEKSEISRLKCSLRASAGGCFVCVDLPEGLPAAPMARKLVAEKGVATIPEMAFQPPRTDGSAVPDRFLRLSYSWATPEEFARSAQALREILA